MISYGYIRILLTSIACYWMFTDPLKAALCFTLSHTVLDDLDGIAARALKQATRFGAVFDIIIDRCSFMMWLMGLCVLYPQYTFLFQLIGLLDNLRMWIKVYGSHFVMCMVIVMVILLSLLLQAIIYYQHYAVVHLPKRNHKSGENSFLLRMYYSEHGLHVFSYGSELYFVALHLCYFSPGPAVPIIGFGIWQIIAAVLFPLVVIKMAINLLILKSGCQTIAEFDSTERSSMQK